MSSEMNFQTVPLTELASKGLTAQTDQPKPVVLVVDDETVIADTLVAILSQNRISAMTAYNGKSALEIARIVPPDLLLSDVVMPDMSGIDLAIAIRQAIPDCKVLLFSGQAATVDLLSSARDAGHDFTALEKPIHPTDLLARISEALHSKEERVFPRRYPSEYHLESAENGLGLIHTD
ncbi:MAG: response regulator [Alloacidobacterium sp.]|jgi:CheY-like chemotaxis protein